MARRSVIWIAAVCVVALVAIVWFMTRPTPAKAADRFVAAVGRGDADATGRLLTSKGREHWGEAARAAGRPTIDIEQAGKVVGKDAEMGGTELSGENAVVTCRSRVDGESKELRLALKHEDGEWRVASVRVVGKDGAEEVALDFEDPATFLSRLMERLKRAADPAILGDSLGRAGRAIKELGAGVERAGDALSTPKAATP